MFAMNSFKDYRTELLLLIPGIFILFQLLHSSTGEIFNREVATSEHFDITKVNVSPDFQDQANVLLSVFQLEDIPVNQASAELLATIPGIGPALAKRIVDERTRSGFYHHPTDLARVHGIGTKRVEQFHRFLRFD